MQADGARRRLGNELARRSWRFYTLSNCYIPLPVTEMLFRCARFLALFTLASPACLAVATSASAAGTAPQGDSFTSPSWPPTRKGCTRKALGPNPDPAYLSACFYAWYEFTADEDRTPQEGRRLLENYATLPFRQALDRDERKPRSQRVRLGGDGVFTLFDEYKGLLYDFRVLGATFDPDSGIAVVRTTLRGFDQNLYLRFVRLGSAWRVDDILPHYDRAKDAKTLRDYLNGRVPRRHENR